MTCQHDMLALTDLTFSIIPLPQHALRADNMHLEYQQ